MNHQQAINDNWLWEQLKDEEFYHLGYNAVKYIQSWPSTLHIHRYENLKSCNLKTTTKSNQLSDFQAAERNA
jgi:hypothetical protein